MQRGDGSEPETEAGENAAHPGRVTRASSFLSPGRSQSLPWQSGGQGAALRRLRALWQRKSGPPGTAQAGAAPAKTGGRIAEDHRLLHVAFAFATGIAVYFLLPAEPVLAAVLLLAGGGLALAVLAHWRGRLTAALLLTAAVLCGLAAGALRTASVAAPVLAEARSVTVTGRVLDRVATGTGSQLVVGLVAAEGLGRQAMPGRVRLSLRGESGAGLMPGDGVRLRARLIPPSGPLRPGGYDFAFAAYYRGIGATGFVFGAPERVDLGPPGQWLTFLAAVERLRLEVAREADVALGAGDESAIAAALLVGLRGEISEQADADLREAGLSHVLSISGLHMVLFAGGMYWLVLAVLAAFPVLALRLPLSRIAAAAALMAATCYLLLSGASVPTQRSYLMIALVFIGLMTGRRGLSLRSVALAALGLLALRPEEIFAPGFQMSFAAVICLIAAYDDYGRWSRQRLSRRRKRPDHGLVISAFRAVGAWVLGVSATSLVAGLATGVIAAYHFDRLSPYGLLGNLLAMPAVSMIVMPAGVAAFLLQPLGLAAPALIVMGEGIWLMLEAARFTAGLSDSDGVIGQVPALAGALMSAAVFWLFLADGWRRGLAVVPALAGLMVWGLYRPPDLYVGDKGTQVAARDADGVLRISGGRIGFAAELWLTAEGIPERQFAGHKDIAAQTRCDGEGCVIAAYPPPSDPGKGAAAEPAIRPLKIALTRKGTGLDSDCLRADIVVTGLAAPPGCKAARVYDASARGFGGVALWLDQEAGRTVITRALPTRPPGQRPWQLAPAVGEAAREAVGETAEEAPTAPLPESSR